MPTRCDGVEADYLTVLNTLDEYDQDAIIKYIGKLKHEIIGLKFKVKNLEKKISKYKLY